MRLTMLLLVIVVMCLTLVMIPAQGAPGMEIESAGIVGVFPLGGEDGFGGILVTGRLPVPWQIGGIKVADVIKGGLVLRNEGSVLDPRDLFSIDKTKAYLALVAQARTQPLGLPVSVGLCYLPLSKLGAGIVVSADLWLKER